MSDKEIKLICDVVVKIYNVTLLKYLLIENKLIICALGNLHYKTSREKFEPEPGFEPRTSGFLAQCSTT